MISLVIALVVLWVLAVLFFKVLGAAVHLLLLAAIGVFLYRFFRSRAPRA